MSKMYMKGMMYNRTIESKKCKWVKTFLLKVIGDRMRERNERASSADDLDMSNSQTSFDGNIYTSSKRRRLAFIDVLLSDESLKEEDIQEEVDTFMFEVQLQAVFGSSSSTSSSFIEVSILIVSYLATFLGTNRFSVFFADVP